MSTHTPLPPDRFAEPIAPARLSSHTAWYDCRHLLEGQGWSGRQLAHPFDRLPAKAEGIVPEPVWGLAQHSAGLCVRFLTDAPTIDVRWQLTGDALAMPHMPATGVSGIDLYGRTAGGPWRFLANGVPTGRDNAASFGGLAPGMELLIYLPLYNGVSRLRLGLPAGSSLWQVRFASAAPPLVWYGTSIVQGGCASRPGLAHTAIAGRLLDRPVINLGFSGNGRMEMALADLLAELPAAAYLLDCVPNMDPEMVTTRVAPFVHRLRVAWPDTPILLLEDTTNRDEVPTVKGRLLRRLHRRLQRSGVANLHFVSAHGMLGSDWEGTVDGVHPNDLGMMRKAEVAARAIGKVLR